MDEPLRQAVRQGRLAGSRYALSQPARVPMGMIGSQLGHRSGTSVEFREHREYQPGDDIRRIDWHAFARTDRLHVKLFREEVNPHLDLLLDGSRSMALADTAKARAAAALSAALASASLNSGYSHDVWITRQGCQPLTNGRQDPLHWEGLTFDHEESVDRAVAHTPPRLRSQSIRVLVSDLLWPGDPMAVLQPLAGNAAMLALVQVLARSDAEPPPRGSVRLVDSETGERRDLFIDAAEQQRYRTALADHLESWNQAAARVGAVMRTFIAEDLLGHWDLKPLVEAEVLKLH